LKLQYEYPEVSKNVCKIIHSMLEFNPFFRGTAKELLGNEVFNGIRSPQLEVDAPF
jgi:serine/threonine protein kinase